MHRVMASRGHICELCWGRVHHLKCQVAQTLVTMVRSPTS
jgi:hypothetical protein